MKKYNITVNGTTYEVLVEEADASSATPTYQAPAYTPAAAKATAAPAKNTPVSGTPVTAPMPGNILDVKAEAGKPVKKGDVICVLEAMKMENEIPAPCDGVIGSVNITKGATVATGDILATIN